MLSLAAAARGLDLPPETRQNPGKLPGFGRMRRVAGLLLGLCGLVLAGCAAPSPQALAANDTYESFNRDSLKRNLFFDEHLVTPILNTYTFLVPEPGRRGIHNVLGNLQLPTIFVNDMLQGQVSRAGQSMWRLAINTTAGLGGVLDPASKMGIPAHGEDFGQTMAVWGAGEGPYLILPVLGPSNPRDATGLAVDLTMDHTNQIHFKQHLWWAAGREFFVLLDLKAQTYQTVQDIQRSSVEYYSSLRSFYRQLRADQIRNGRKAGADLPDF